MGKVVDILFRDKKSEQLCNNDKIATQKLGIENARKLRLRMDALYAAPNLECMRKLPGRCHELSYARKGEISIDLAHPLRLIFMPLGDDILKSDGGLDWAKIRTIEIISVGEDTHE